MSINDINPSPALYIRVRAGFVAQGTTLTAWCRENHLADRMWFPLSWVFGTDPKVEPSASVRFVRPESTKSHSEHRVR